MEGNNRERGFQWWDSEVTDLINIWGDVAVQAKLKGIYCNCSMFEETTKEMAKYGHKKTLLQCQRKVKSLKAKLKKRRTKEVAVDE